MESLLSQVDFAKAGKVTPEMETVAHQEGLPVETIRERIEKGQIVIPLNKNKKVNVVGIGLGLRTKVNASVGTSTDIVDVAMEVEKARAAEEAGADTLMELSVGGDLNKIRREVIASVNLPVGNVPLYQAFCEATRKYGDPNKLDKAMLFDLIEKQCEDGIAFMAVHCGINLYTLERLKKQGYRYGGLVSKGGTSMVAWMMTNGKENPLYEYFDEVAQILRKHDVVLSLGNGLRAGAISDSMDRAMVQELIINCELAEIGREMGCQMMVEGPGHVPLDEIEANIILEKRMSGGAPYYMLGPLPTDVAAGWDHITAAIGAAQSSRYGADLICYITPAEHLGLPNREDVITGVKTARIAAHIGDLSKLKEKTLPWDRNMSIKRRDMDWEAQFNLAMFPEDARQIYQARSATSESQTCTMCGEYCANKGSLSLFQDVLEKSIKKEAIL